MQAKKMNAVGCKVSVVWSLEVGVTIHENHELLWYKVKGFPQFFPTANSSKQLKQRSISCTSPPIYRSLLLQPSGMLVRPAVNSVPPTLNSLSLHPTAFYFAISPTLFFFISLTPSSSILVLTLSYLSWLSQSSSSRTCFLRPLLNFLEPVILFSICYTLHPYPMCMCVCLHHQYVPVNPRWFHHGGAAGLVLVQS